MLYKDEGVGGIYQVSSKVELVAKVWMKNSA